MTNDFLFEEDISWLDLENESDDVMQLPEHEWFNDRGADITSLTQIQTPDLEHWELLEAESVEDELDTASDAELAVEVDATAEDVPFSYQWWLHDEDTIVDDAVSAPPESGDVDPETGAIVP